MYVCGFGVGWRIISDFTVVTYADMGLWSLLYNRGERYHRLFCLFVFLSIVLFEITLLSVVQKERKPLSKREKRKCCNYACAKYKLFNISSQFTISAYLKDMTVCLFVPVFIGQCF